MILTSSETSHQGYSTGRRNAGPCSGGVCGCAEAALFSVSRMERLFGGDRTAADVFMVVTAEAFPDVLGAASPVLRPPYVAMSNVTVLRGDVFFSGQSPALSIHSYKGNEIVRMEMDPDDRLHQAIINFHASMHLLFLRFVPGQRWSNRLRKDAWFSAYVKSGCVDKGDVVIGHEKVLGYETTVVQNTGLPRARVGDGYDGWRWTGWLAPDLGALLRPASGDWRPVFTG